MDKMKGDFLLGVALQEWLAKTNSHAIDKK